MRISHENFVVFHIAISVMKLKNDKFWEIRNQGELQSINNMLMYMIVENSIAGERILFICT